MQIEGTREAFLRIVNEPGFAKRTGYNKSLVSLWASGGRIPTLDKMEEVLLNCGAVIISEKKWDILPNE